MYRHRYVQYYYVLHISCQAESQCAAHLNKILFLTMVLQFISFSLEFPTLISNIFRGIWVLSWICSFMYHQRTDTRHYENLIIFNPFLILYNYLYLLSLEASAFNRWWIMVVSQRPPVHFTSRTVFSEQLPRFVSFCWIQSLFRLCIFKRVSNHTLQLFCSSALFTEQSGIVSKNHHNHGWQEEGYLGKE